MCVSGCKGPYTENLSVIRDSFETKISEACFILLEVQLCFSSAKFRLRWVEGKGREEERKGKRRVMARGGELNQYLVSC